MILLEDDLPGSLPFGQQVSFKSYLPSKKIYLSRITRFDFFESYLASGKYNGGSEFTTYLQNIATEQKLILNAASNLIRMPTPPLSPCLVRVILVLSGFQAKVNHPICTLFCTIDYDTSIFVFVACMIVMCLFFLIEMLLSNF